jgi:starvation-inducible DNA-binding protein
VAERIAQLGGTVVTTVRYIAANSKLREFPTTITSGEEHVLALVTSASAIIVRLRDAAAEAMAVEDIVTAAVLTDVQRSAEKFLWLLEAHLPKVLRR